jgi:hypothetical protein
MALFATESNSWTPSDHIVDSKECERGASPHIPALQSAAHGHVLPGGQMNFPPRARQAVQTFAADQVHQCGLAPT